MTELHPSEQHWWLCTNRDTSIAGWLCAVAAWSLTAVAGYSNQPPVKVGSFGSALVVAVAGNRSRRVARATEAILQDSQDISDQSRQNRLYEAFRPGQSALVSVSYETPLEFFEWELLKTSPAQFPHLMIEGSTGTGKTSLTEFLISLLPGERLVITPKRKVSQWKGLSVIGSPLNFPAIQTAFDTLLTEMENRYFLMDQGQEDYPSLNFVVDEYPLIAANCDGISDTMMMLVRAAREAGMRMLLVAQGSEGKALDIEGQTSVRECFTRIRLGKSAVDYARKLKRPNLVAWLEQQSRPCMVDDLPAIVPDLVGFQISPALPTSSFPDVQDSLKPKLETSGVDQQVLELLEQGKTKTDVIWEVWHAKPGRGKDYANAKREFERIIRKQR
jgi:DNA polymerase III delta prime subunit